MSKIVYEYRKAHKLSMEAMADIAGLSKGYIAIIEKENNPISGKPSTPSFDTLQKLAKAMGMSTDALVNMMDDDDTVSLMPELTFVQIPLYENICCGNGGFVDDNVIGTIPLPTDMLNPHTDYFAQKASGDSMTGEGIKPGDILVFEKTGHCDSGQIGCFCIDDNNAMCKKYRVTENNQIMLMPANEKYDPIIVDIESEHFRCIGVLVYSVHSFK
ncbi:MAG: S24 family peptidase [Prevotella sp.]